MKIGAEGSIAINVDRLQSLPIYIFLAFSTIKNEQQNVILKFTASHVSHDADQTALIMTYYLRYFPQS